MKKWLKNSLLICLSLIVALLLYEVILRISGFSNFLYYQPDEVLGHRPNPGARGWFQNEGKAYVRINEAGWRDHEHSETKPANTLRIAVLGDSYTEALQVSLEETFWSVVMKQLGICKQFDQKSVEVINFGVSAYGTAQEYLTLRNYVWKYSPDIVLLTFFTGNDVRNNSKILEPIKLRPFFFLKGETLHLDNSFRNEIDTKQKRSFLASLWELSYRYSRVRQFVRYVKTAVKQRVRDEVDPNIPGEEIVLGPMMYREPETRDWQEAWKITEALLVEMHKETVSKNARFVVVTLTNSIQVHPDREVRENFMKEHTIRDLFYPDNRIKRFSQREGIETLILAPIFQRYADETGVFLHGFERTGLGTGHWNSNGHRLAGEIIADHLCNDKGQLSSF
jgi:hypothetical protein